jgi:hypothetical protein
MIALSAIAFAQTDKGSIQGTLASARGPLPNVEVRIRNIATGQILIATTTSRGDFSAAVTPGTYDVFATPTGYTPLARHQIQVKAGAIVRVDGMLGDNPNAGTPGEIFFLYSREGTKPPAGPTPRLPNGKPDLSGVWLPSADLEPDVPPLQEWAAKVAKEHASRPGDDPRAQCLPTGVVRTNALDLAKFVHTPNLLLIVLEGSVPGMRQVFLDGRRHPADPNPTWLGDSIGRGITTRSSSIRSASTTRAGSITRACHRPKGCTSSNGSRAPISVTSISRSPLTIRRVHQAVEGASATPSRARRRDPRVHLQREPQDRALRREVSATHVMPSSSAR